jgi:hypothetical protein
MDLEEFKKCIDKIKELETKEEKSLKYSTMTEPELIEWATKSDVDLFLKNNNA